MNTAVGGTYQARHIQLDSPDTVPNSESGTLTVIPPGVDDQPFIYLHFTVAKLPPKMAFGRDYYALYLETPSNGRVRVMSFNTGGSAWSFSSDLAFSSGNLDAWLTEPLTVFVTHERDDGIDGHIGEGAYVLRGVSD
jgi:hypothetical protein